MKKLSIFNLLMIFFSIISFASCHDSYDNNDPGLATDFTVSHTNLEFANTGGTTYLYVSSNSQPTVSSTVDWITVTQEASTSSRVYKFKLTASSYAQTDDRTGSINVVSQGNTATVSVTQLATDGLILEASNADVGVDGETITVTLKANGNFTTAINADWITETTTRANMQTYTRLFVVAANSGVARTATISFTLGSIVESFTVNQEGLDLPADGVESDAKTLIAKIGIGWNLGNTLEATGGETAWGNPLTTKQFIDGVKAAGFNAVRIPCAWDSHIDDRSTYHISTEWLARVKEIVNYCVVNRMYVILNSHWDGGWLEENPYLDKMDAINAEQKAIWTQIANEFKDYDEHLLFAGTNEVHKSDYSNPTADNIKAQESFNQTFVDAVRATGGNNAKRVLVVQSYNTNIEQAVQLMTMPTDIVEDRLVLEVHYYDPYNFTLNTGEGWKAYWGTPYAAYGIDSWGQEDYMQSTLNSLKAKFIDNNIPVIVGEYGVNRRNLSGEALTKHLESRAYWYKTFNQYCAVLGIKTFVWDTGGGGNNNNMSLLNRTTGAVIDQQCVDAIKAGAGL